jgi:hypothetical protein
MSPTEERVVQSVKSVLAQLPAEDRKRLAPWSIEVGALSHGVWGETSAEGLVVISPKVADLTDRALDELMCHELAHLAVVRILGGSVSDEAAASRVNLSRWNHGVVALCREIVALREGRKSA